MEIVMYSLFYQKSQNPFKANRFLVIMRYIHCSVVFYQGDLRERFGTSQVADLELDTIGCRDESFGAEKAPSVTVFFSCLSLLASRGQQGCICAAELRPQNRASRCTCTSPRC